MGDTGVDLWLHDWSAFCVGALGLVAAILGLFRTSRLSRVGKRTQIAVEAISADSRLWQLDEKLRRHATEWSSLARTSASMEIRSECEAALKDIRRIGTRNEQLRKILTEVERSLDALPAVLVSHSLLDRTHSEFVTLTECVDGEIEQVAAYDQRLEQVRAEVAALVAGPATAAPEPAPAAVAPVAVEAANSIATAHRQASVLDQPLYR